MEVNKYYIDFAKDILTALKLSATPNRISFLYAWMSGENTQAKYNPLATTWNMITVDPKQTNFNFNNGYPVKNYGSKSIGLIATVNTLKNGYYPEIIKYLTLDQNIGVASTALIMNLKLWGTGMLPITIYRSWPVSFKKKLMIGGGIGLGLAIATLIIIFRKKIFQ